MYRGNYPLFRWHNRRYMEQRCSGCCSCRFSYRYSYRCCGWYAKHHGIAFTISTYDGNSGSWTGTLTADGGTPVAVTGTKNGPVAAAVSGTDLGALTGLQLAVTGTGSGTIPAPEPLHPSGGVRSSGRQFEREASCRRRGTRPPQPIRARGRPGDHRAPRTCAYARA